MKVEVNNIVTLDNDADYLETLIKCAKKEDADGNLYVDETSDLATLIENAGAIDSIKEDWTTSLN